MDKILKNYLGSLCWFSLGLQNIIRCLEDLGIVCFFLQKVNLGL